MDLIRAFQKNEKLLEDIKAHGKDPTHVHLWWLGQSGFLLAWNEKYVLLDPYLSDSLTDKYKKSDKPHTRISEKVIDPETLDFIDIVTSSHNHTDHLDAGTLIPLITVNKDISMVIPEANREFVCNRIQMPHNFPIGMNDGIRKEIKGITFIGIPAAHNLLERDEKGQCLFMGYIIQMGGVNIYHSGDTLLFEGMEELLASYNIDIALLPINGNDPSRGVAGNLNAEEAARLASRISAKLTVPCHYDLFSFNTADPTEFAEDAREHHINYRILKLGEGLSIPAR